MTALDYDKFNYKTLSQFDAGNTVSAIFLFPVYVT